MLQDLKHSFRIWLRDPSFTLISVAILALGIASSADGGAINNAKAAYCDAASTKQALVAQAQALDAFNKSGDALPFPPGVPNPGPADPQLPKAVANRGFWDTLP